MSREEWSLAGLWDIDRQPPLPWYLTIEVLRYVTLLLSVFFENSAPPKRRRWSRASRQWVPPPHRGSIGVCRRCVPNNFFETGFGCRLFETKQNFMMPQPKFCRAASAAKGFGETPELIQRWWSTLALDRSAHLLIYCIVSPYRCIFSRCLRLGV